MVTFVSVRKTSLTGTGAGKHGRAAVLSGEAWGRAWKIRFSKDAVETGKQMCGSLGEREQQEQYLGWEGEEEAEKGLSRKCEGHQEHS